ncbi:MAG: hypothetical protein ACKOQ7_10300, partial [Actinomycetota bacterium]
MSVAEVWERLTVEIEGAPGTVGTLYAAVAPRESPRRLRAFTATVTLWPAERPVRVQRVEVTVAVMHDPAEVVTTY